MRASKKLVISIQEEGWEGKSAFRHYNGLLSTGMGKVCTSWYQLVK